MVIKSLKGVHSLVSIKIKENKMQVNEMATLKKIRQETVVSLAVQVTQWGATTCNVL